MTILAKITQVLLSFSRARRVNDLIQPLFSSRESTVHSSDLSLFIGSLEKPLECHTVELTKLEEKHSTLLEGSVALARLGNVDAALDLLYDRVDELLCGGNFEEIDRMLREASPTVMPTELAIGVLTASLPARGRLRFRGVFFDKVEQLLEQRGERDARLLRGLEEF